jgi:uncharacterized protein YecT (DUF1311 family)
MARSRAALFPAEQEPRRVRQRTWDGSPPAVRAMQQSASLSRLTVTPACGRYRAAVISKIGTAVFANRGIVMRAIALVFAGLLGVILPAFSQGASHEQIISDCAAQADARGFHGIERKTFRSQCQADAVHSPAPAVAANQAGEIAADSNIANPRMPSLYCKPAKSAMARLICSDSDLVKAEGVLDRTYADQLSKLKGAEKKEAIVTQAKWIRARTAACLSDNKAMDPIERAGVIKQCMIKATDARIAQLNGKHFPADVQMFRDLDQIILRQYARCFAPPAQVDSEYRPKIDVTYAPDGSLMGMPVLVNPPGDASLRPMAQSAMRTVRDCNPIKIPRRFAASYTSWYTRRLVFVFENMNPAARSQR